MSKILLIAEKINNEAKFIKNLKQITGKSISEIKENLKNKTHFFEGPKSGNLSDETEEAVKKILDFANQEKDVIRLFILLNSNASYEITQEIYENQLKAAKESSDYLDELDEM